MNYSYKKLTSVLGMALIGISSPCAAQNALTPDDCVNSVAITSMPDGVLHDNLFRSGVGMYCYGGSEQVMEIDGEVGRIVVNGDKIYVYDPLISGHTYTWMEGKLSDDGKVIIPTPQLVMGSEAEGWREFLMNCIYDKETATGVPDMENTDIVYSYVDGVLKLEEGIPSLFEWGVPTDPWTWEPIGDTPQWIWSGYADTECLIEPFDYSMQQPPANIVLEDYQLYSIQGGVTICRDVKLGISGNEVWVNGLEDNYPEAFVKGTLDNGELVFDSQFICLDEKVHLFQFLLPAVAEFEGDGDEASSYSISDKVTMTYNAEDGSFSAPRNQVLFVNGGVKSIYALSIFEAPALRKKFTGQLEAPADPLILQWQPFNDSGYAALVIGLPQVDINGNYIPTEDLFYVLYDGEEEIELSPELFPNVEDYIVEIPYDWWCYDIVPNGPTRTVYFYFDVENPGVRLSYDSESGKILSSNTVYAIQTNIESSAAEKKVVREELYDLNGRPANNLTKGIVIKKVTYDDGTMHVKKQLTR